MRKLTFIQIADLHYSNMNTSVEEIRDAIGKDITDNIKSEYNIDFVIFSGDFVNGKKLSLTKENEIKLFEEAFNNFISPIIEKFSLTKDNIFITPGNHDLNRSLVAKSAYNTYSFKSEDDIQNITSDIEKDLISFSHFEQYNSFIASLKNSNEISNSKLYKVYKIKIHTFELGIICLNNCLNSFNSENIHGNVIMAEKELNKALKELSDCHIKILNMHYPLSWTNKYEHQKLINLVAKNFNMVFVGHEHFKVFTQANINSYDTFTYNAPSLFQGDDKTCGYTIFEYDFEDKQLKIHFREYDFEDKCFKSSNELDICYMKDFNIFNNLGKEKQNILVIDSLIDNFYSYINTSSLFTKSNYSLSFDNMFVLPQLSAESSYKDSENISNEHFLIKDILKDSENYIFYGSELIGKTSLLYYIATYYMKYKTEHLKIPIYINLSELGKINKSSFISEIKSFLDIYTNLNNSNKFIQEQLDNNSFILLLDNLTTNEDDRRTILDLLNKDFGQLKIFITSIEDSYKNITFSNSDISENILIEENNKFKSLFIHSYKREQVRLFFKNWFSEKFDEYMFEKFYDYINKFNIPATPFIFSLLCISYEKGIYEEYPNEIILLEAFIDNLLGKGDTKKDKKEISYKLKKKYLSNLASKIIKSRIETIDKFEVESFTSEFLKTARMYDVNTYDVIRYFVKKDIIVLSKDNTLYKFKFKTFLEYFIALEMKNNNDFKEEVLSSYLSYTEEIKFYAGITESIDNYKQLINKFFNIIRNNFNIYEEIKENTGAFLYSDADISELVISKESDIFNKLEYKEKDELLEVDNKTIIKSNIKKVINEKKISEEEGYYKTNLLSMSILKYAETVEESDLIDSFLKLVLESHSKLFFSIMNRIEEVDKEKLLELLIDYNKENNIEDKNLNINKILDILKSFYNVLTSIFSNILNQNLFDEHIINVINENINQYNTITKLFILMYYINENSNKMFKYFDLLIIDFKEDKNKYKGYFFTILYFSILRIKLDLINQKFKDKLIDKLLEMIEALYPSQNNNAKNMIETQRRKQLLISINK
ncbi:metallophosphoesterase [Aliarcobacter butzleri]|uniref:metallophosphoesterase n=1 Tax=Aliarcobacter butzleri TaxID=28197 RepID=UPI0021B3C108|nr:metallophosphoesterase [Aliarcobacter butzleri]MCT7619405.1 metallophosphoesterase [Aliarcobacter butzleri]